MPSKLRSLPQSPMTGVPNNPLHCTALHRRHQEMSGEADALNDQVQQLHARISRLRREQRALQRRLVVARTNGPAAAIAMGDSGSPELGGKRPNTTGSSMPDRPQTVNNITRRVSNPPPAVTPATNTTAWMFTNTNMHAHTHTHMQHRPRWPSTVSVWMSLRLVASTLPGS